VDWLGDWVRDYYEERGYSGEALERAVEDALDGTRDPSVKPAVFRVKVTEETFKISPYNTRYASGTSLKTVADTIDERTRRNIRQILLHPIIVRPAERYGTWYVVAGVRRAAALIGEYAHIRVYMPRDWREEALLSIYENIVRMELDGLGLLLVAERAERLGVKDEMVKLLDEKTAKLLEEMRRPGTLEPPKVEPLWEPTPPQGRPSGKASKQQKTTEVECPVCGEPLKPVCARCGAPVQ
jgi:hypothetical protein